MRNFRPYMFSVAYFIIGVAAFYTSDYRLWSYLLLAVSIAHLIDKIGKGIALRETIALMYTFICVFIPTFGYTTFNRTNVLAQVWLRYMMIPEDQYFTLAIPAISFFSLALTFPISNRRYSDAGLPLNNIFLRLKAELKSSTNPGLLMMGIGVVSYFMYSYLPGGLQYFFSLFFFSSFAGLLYIYYDVDFPKRKLVLTGFLVFILMTALNSGMFTLVVYMGAAAFSFFFLGKGPRFFSKVLVFSLALFSLFMVQSVKRGYRKAIWMNTYTGSRPALFGELIVDRLVNMNELVSEDAMFPVYYRSNQGFNIGLVMLRFPKRVSFDGGEKLVKSFLSAFVPRFLWPDKPMAGGKENMFYYTGYVLRGYSTNVGPLGEAYGSFGVKGAILYLFLLGILLRFAFVVVLRTAIRIPALLCWVPMIFYQVTYSGESDSLQIFNSLVKSAIFILLMYKAYPPFFRFKEKANRALSHRSIIPVP